jgi:hypothetical protein
MDAKTSHMVLSVSMRSLLVNIAIDGYPKNQWMIVDTMKDGVIKRDLYGDGEDC